MSRSLLLMLVIPSRASLSTNLLRACTHISKLTRCHRYHVQVGGRHGESFNSRIGRHSILCRNIATSLEQMSKPSVLLIGDLTHCNDEWSALAKKYNLKEFRTGKRDQFLDNCRQGQYDEVVGLYRSNVSVAQTGPFDKELLSVVPKSLRYVCHNGAGYDNIDVEAFTQRGISISSTPIAVDDSTADTGIFLMLGALRHAQIPLEAIRAGEWRGKAPLGHDPKGKTLGILGMGGIGRV